MSQISKDLYEFIIQNECSLTDEWLSKRIKVDGSTYSKNAALEIEKQLRLQNTKFIEAVSLVFIQERGEYGNFIEDWVATVAKERVQQAVPLHEVITQLRIFREIYWGFVRKFFEENPDATSEDALRWSEAINHAFDYIIERFAIHHHEATQRILASQQAVINELSSPVIPIKKGVGILPLVGDIDTHRAKVILETALEQSVKRQLHTLYIDLSAVAIIDTMVAQQLFQLMASLKIIGVQSVLSGIRPEIAQTAVTLGINFKDIKIQANLMRALETYES
ncbi:STAS domain-containing protein [Planomicrobium sp. CPCC 101079]|uniref:STAS domain-containing protein n=1 Tax=Planomicrobium sp. CPCC 101079 TaxID=2599618 RepID=UPI0011B6F718|nr:STAS domain-containing protein [Planomicrobium sp. CPCC 101079]TWT02351.1 STAS domain-containing protein [Planomicrobium sp. CPCC 101079]